MSASITINGLSEKKKNIVSRVVNLSNLKQTDFLDFVSKMTTWEFQVFDAFRSRLRIDDIIEKNSQTSKNYRLFIENPCDEVARLLVSTQLHKWRPAGIGIFAELVRLHQSRDDNAIIKAIEKASEISIELFREEYPECKKISPKNILIEILQKDYEITLSKTKSDTKKVYDGLRNDEEEK